MLILILINVQIGTLAYNNIYFKNLQENVRLYEDEFARTLCPGFQNNVKTVF